MKMTSTRILLLGLTGLFSAQTTFNVSASTSSGVTGSVDSVESGSSPANATNASLATNATMLNSTISESQNSTTVATTFTTNAADSSQAINRDPTRQPGDIIPKLIGENISLPLSIRFLNANISQEDLTENNLIFEKYHQILYEVYSREAGFQEMNITKTKFSAGSLTVDYTVTFKYDPKKTNDYYIKTTLEDATNRLSNNPDVDKDALNSALNAATLSSLGDRLCDIMYCPDGYTCQHEDNVIPHIQCIHACKTSDLNCHNGGDCVLNKNFQPVCRCPTVDGFIYGGKSCEQKAEMLDMSKDNIIAIAAGAGGGVVLIFIIIIMVVCCTKSSKIQKKEVNVKDDASEQSFKSMKDSEDGLHLAYSGKVNTAAMADPSFRRSDSKVSQQLRQEPYVVSSASLQPTNRNPRDIVSSSSIQPNTRNPRDIVDSYADYRYQGPRSQVENMEMRRQSRVRVSDDIEINPDYGRAGSRPRDSIDIGSPYRKNSTFHYLAQRRRSSAPVDWRGNKVTQNPLFTAPANRRKSSVYMEIDDNDSKSVMYQPATNVDQPTRTGPAVNTIDHPLRLGGQQQAKVYDYYNRKESVASVIYPRPRAASNADLYDFDEDNNPMRNVYGGRRIQQGPTSPRRF